MISELTVNIKKFKNCYFLFDSNEMDTCGYFLAMPLDLFSLFAYCIWQSEKKLENISWWSERVTISTHYQ